ncbi:MAG: hypothetical protein ABL899_00205 [Nitrospira sp.]
MSINDLLEKVKPFYTLFLLSVIASIFFAFGRLSAIEERHQPIKIEYLNGQQTASGIVATTPTGSTPTSQTGEVIGSKSGKKYYFPWCGTVKMIKPENQIHFSSIDEAKKAGFVAGGNCKGLR